MYTPPAPVICEKCNHQQDTPILDNKIAESIYEQAENLRGAFNALSAIHTTLQETIAVEVRKLESRAIIATIEASIAVQSQLPTGQLTTGEAVKTMENKDKGGKETKKPKGGKKK